MSIRVTCPWCEDSFKARDEYAGKRVKCPKCGEVLQVPEGADASADARPEPRRPPVLSPITDQTIEAGQQLKLAVNLTDPGYPPARLKFALVRPLAGAQITPDAGHFTWTPARSR